MTGSAAAVRDVASLVALAEDLVVRLAALEPSDLTTDVIEHVGLVVADSVGVMIAGARSAEIVALAEDPSLHLSDAATTVTPSRVFVPGDRYGDPATAAWLNGSAGTFLELDEGFRPTGHPAMHLVPAALAVGEAIGASGSEMVGAVAAGYEVAGRLFESFALPGPMHPHGHFGAIGAALAVAKLTGADAVALARIAATQPLLTGWEACYDGASARNTWTGHSNRVGVLAGTLHRAGFTGSLASHLSVVAPYLVDDGRALAESVSVETLRIRRNYFKFHSACALSHSALDAVREAWGRLSVRDPWAVRRVDVATISANLRVDRLAQPNALSTRFSLPYAVAAALLTGSTGPASFEHDRQVAEYARRVVVTADPALDAAWPASAPARVRIETLTETAEATVDNPYGHHRVPPSRDELRDKFVSLVVDEGAAEQFDRLADVGALEKCSALAFRPAAEGTEVSRFRV